jgi:hypothetical protein
MLLSPKQKTYLERILVSKRSMLDYYKARLRESSAKLSAYELIPDCSKLAKDEQAECIRMRQAIADHEEEIVVLEHVLSNVKVAPE